jgi:alpha-tubulin suppressor-like RCC1 family protein
LTSNGECFSWGQGANGALGLGKLEVCYTPQHI